jgi:sugar lactone lactonase YvrE
MSTAVPTIDAQLFCQADSVIGEGPFWHQQRFYWVDILGSSLHSCDATGSDSAFYSLPSHVGAAAPWDDGFIAATKDGVGVVSEAGHFSLLAESPLLGVNLRCNDGKLDPAGRFWFGTCDYEFTPGAGALYRVSQNGGVQKILDGLILPNGLAWDEHAERFYFIDTFTHRIDVFDFDLSSGEIANRRVAIEMPREFGLPDGMCCDSFGRLWVAFWGGSRVMGFDPHNGEPIAMVHVPTRLTSSCCVDPEGRGLYITTARNTLSPDTLRAEPLAGSVFRATLPS